MKGPDPSAIPFRRERLLAVGALAFLAPIPLAFSYAVEVPWLLGYLGALGAFLAFVWRGRIPCLSLTVLNLAGLAYAVFFYSDLRFGSRRLLYATLHLLLFTTLVKLASVRKERDFAIALALTGFLFLASIATSIHSSILLFVVLYLAVAWPVLVRWGIYRDLAGAEEEWRRDPHAVRLPGAGAVALSVLATLAVATPLFFSLPRLKGPFVRGLDEGQEVTTGFSERVDPDVFGILKRSDRVYMRVSAEEPIMRLAATTLRLRTLAFTIYDGRTWRKPAGTIGGRRGALGALLPLPGVAVRQAARHRRLSIDLLPLDSRFVPYPTGSPGVVFPVPPFRAIDVAVVDYDDGRNLLLPFPPERTIHYQALYGPALPDLEPPRRRDRSLEDPGKPRVAEWARRVIGGVDPAASPEEAAAAIERELSTRYAYSLEIPRAGSNPTEEFLFDRRAGHCETFASAMALALRELGIPSRFVTGFAGGELGFLGRYLIVRGRDAHAWVEAWCGPDRGWVAFDPTPPVGRPGVERVPLTGRLRQLGDGIELLYDRYVLSFGQSDQAELIRAIREKAETATARLKAGMRRLRGTGWALARRGPGALLVLGLLVLLALAARGLLRRVPAAAWRTRGLPPAAATYRRLQKLLRRRGAPVTPASTPAETLEAVRAWGPHAHRCAREIVVTYVAQSFGGVPPDAEGEGRLEARLRSVAHVVRKSREATAARG